MQIALLAVLAGLMTPMATSADQHAHQSTTACTPLKQIYARANWRDPTPINAQTPCEGHRAKWKRSFGMYRHYRQIARIRCLRGSEGYFVIPCYVIQNESNFSWGAYNPSGAVGIYQLLGWGAPYPANTFRERLRNHEIARYVLRVQGLSAWAGA